MGSFMRERSKEPITQEYGCTSNRVWVIVANRIVLPLP